MLRKFSGFIISAGCLLSACDKGSDNSAKPAEPPPATQPLLQPALPPHPTTQQLDSAPRVSLNLKYAPLSLMVPQTLWSLNPYNMETPNPQWVLEGPTPSDKIEFRIASPRPLAGDSDSRLANQVKLLELHANEMLKAHPELFGDSVVHDIDGGKVIEQVVIKTITDLKLTPEEIALKIPATTQPVQTVQWTFTVVIPAGKAFTAYDLTASVPLDSYKADHKFVRAIMDTLKYDPSLTDAVIH